MKRSTPQPTPVSTPSLQMEKNKNKRSSLCGAGIPGYRMNKRMISKTMICKATYRLLRPLGHKLLHEWKGTLPGAEGSKT